MQAHNFYETLDASSIGLVAAQLASIAGFLLIVSEWSGYVAEKQKAKKYGRPLRKSGKILEEGDFIL